MSQAVNTESGATMGDETMVRFYTKEEEFLEEFGYHGIASAVRRVVGDDTWNPEYQANDDTRRQVKYALVGHLARPWP